MKPDAYHRNIAARAFDVARYLLPFGIPTGVGQVTSIRTLEKQMRRLKASEFQELRELGDELALACARSPACVWDSANPAEPVAPTLARHAEPDEYTQRLHADLAEWAQLNLPKAVPASSPMVDLLQPSDHLADICATLLFPVTQKPYRELYELAQSWTAAQRQEVLDVALGSRARRDELPRHFRSAPYVLDIVMDIGAYRDLHRHRRCQQFRQHYTNQLGYETPDLINECGARRNTKPRWAPSTKPSPSCLSPPPNTCCLSLRAPASSSKWTSPNSNTSAASAVESRVTSPTAKSPGK